MLWGEKTSISFVICIIEKFVKYQVSYAPIFSEMKWFVLPKLQVYN